MKRFISVLLIVTMLFSLAGCSSEVPPEKMNAEQYREWVNTTPYEKIVDWARNLSDEEYEQWANGGWSKNLTQEQAHMWRADIGDIRNDEESISWILPVWYFYDTLKVKKIPQYIDQQTHQSPSDMKDEELAQWIKKANIVDCVQWMTNIDLDEDANLSHDYFNITEVQMIRALDRYVRMFKHKKSVLPESAIIPQKMLTLLSIKAQGEKKLNDKKPENMSAYEFTRWIENTPVLDVLTWGVSLTDEEYNDWVYGEWIDSLPTERINYELPTETWIRLFDCIRNAHKNNFAIYSVRTPRGYPTPYSELIMYSLPEELSVVVEE